MQEHKTREQLVQTRQLVVHAVKALGLVPVQPVAQVTLRVLLVIGRMAVRLLRWVHIIIVLRMPAVAWPVMQILKTQEQRVQTRRLVLIALQTKLLRRVLPA